MDGLAPSLGRATGSASIETLVRVGLEKETGGQSQMFVLHDFTPCVDDELEVKRGQMVSVLYQENDWVYVIAEDNSEGFIPHSYCAPLTSQLAAELVKHKKLPRSTVTTSINGITSDSDQGRDMDTYSATASDIHPFFKDPSGRYVVLYTFIARDENDVSVERGEFITVLNKDDPDWFWIIRSNAQEGFVPASFLCPIEIAIGKVSSNNTSNPMKPCNSSIINNNNINNNSNNGPSNNNNIINNINNSKLQQVDYQSTRLLTASNNGHIQESSTYSNSVSCKTSQQSQPVHSSTDATDSSGMQGSELVMVHDYKAQTSDELNVRRGDFILADLRNQEVEGWLWAFLPSRNKFGFIPKSYAEPPTQTSI